MIASSEQRSPEVKAIPRDLAGLISAIGSVAALKAMPKVRAVWALNHVVIPEDLVLVWPHLRHAREQWAELPNPVTDDGMWQRLVFYVRAVSFVSHRVNTRAMPLEVRRRALDIHNALVAVLEGR